MQAVKIDHNKLHNTQMCETLLGEVQLDTISNYISHASVSWSPLGLTTRRCEQTTNIKLQKIVKN